MSDDDVHMDGVDLTPYLADLDDSLPDLRTGEQWSETLTIVPEFVSFEADRVEIKTLPGGGASILVDGVEMNDVVVAYSVRADGIEPVIVTLELLAS